MEISNEYKSRHGFADFEHNLFQITSGENIVETCNLVKVPKYTYTNTYVEKICEEFNFPYHSLKMLKFPIYYKDFVIHKTLFK